MPREARSYAIAPYYHVMVQGINKKYILDSDYHKMMYLKLLNKYIKEKEILIIAYCIMGNHVHLLLKPKTINDLSECMKKINTTFAMRYNKANERVGYVFRNRFKSEPIYETNYLHNCIKYIHMNPVKAGICEKQIDYNFSSYKKYIDKVWFEDKNLYNEIFNNDEEYQKVIDDVGIECEFLEEEFSINEAENWLYKYLENMHFKYSDIYTREEILSNVIKNLKKECRVKNIVIAKLMNLSESKISRILKR